MDKNFEVRINNKVIKLRGGFVGDRYCVESSSINNHPFLSSSEKDSLKEALRNDPNITLI